MGALARLRARSPGTVPRVATAAVLLLVIDVAVVVLPFARMRRALLGTADALARIVPGHPSVHAVIWAVEVADGRVPGERKCLVRSLTAEFLLRLYAITPEHRIGVHPQEDLEAHSWLEYDGDVLIGDLEDLEKYEPLPPLEAH